jgi:hypothetical protein
MRTAVRIAVILYILQAAIGAAVGFSLPWMQYLAN